MELIDGVIGIKLDHDASSSNQIWSIWPVCRVGESLNFTILTRAYDIAIEVLPAYLRTSGVIYKYLRQNINQNGWFRYFHLDGQKRSLTSVSCGELSADFREMMICLSFKNLLIGLLSDFRYKYDQQPCNIAFYNFLANYNFQTLTDYFSESQGNGNSEIK